MIADVQEKEEKVEDEEVDPEYPILPQYCEKYDTIVILSKNETDMTYIENLLQLEKKKSYKNSFTGKCYVLTVREVASAIKNSLSV